MKEDIQWAYDIISANKLYVGGFEGFKLSEEKPEVKAWTNLIALKSLPLNKLEMERLKKYDINDNAGKNDDKIKLTMKMSTNEAYSGSKKRKDDDTNNHKNVDESKMMLLNQS